MTGARVAALLGVVAGFAVGAGAVRLAGDVTTAIAVGVVYGVAVGVGARWEPVARERGIWGGIGGRTGSLAAGGVVAMALVAALFGVHPALAVDADTTLVLRLLVVGCVFAGLYVGVAAVLVGIEDLPERPPEEDGTEGDGLDGAETDDETETDDGEGTDDRRRDEAAEG